MRVVASASLALLVLAALAGCSEGPRAPADIVIQSAPPEEIRSGEEALGQSPATEVFEKSASVRGHIAGVVVDEAIRPIQGAVVRLPGMNMERATEQDGSFGFVDLYPGPYYLTVEMGGFYKAEAMLEVKSEEFTRAKVVLAAIPPPEPYHVTMKFDGFAEATDSALDPFRLGFLCTKCDFEVYLDRPGLREVVVEAVLESGTSSNGFTYDLAHYECCDSAAYGTSGHPLLLPVKAKDLGAEDEDRFWIHMYPTSSPAPEMSKRFQVFVTTFYNGEAPTGWSFVNGSA